MVCENDTEGWLVGRWLTANIDSKHQQRANVPTNVPTPTRQRANANVPRTLDDVMRQLATPSPPSSSLRVHRSSWVVTDGVKVAAGGGCSAWFNNMACPWSSWETKLSAKKFLWQPQLFFNNNNNNVA